MSVFGEAIIVAGGQGKRMGGKEKALLTIHGQTILQRQLEVLRQKFSRVWISVNDVEKYRAYSEFLVMDKRQNLGPMSGVASGLREAMSDYVFVVAGDMPLINLHVIEVMAERIREGGDSIDVVVTKVEGRFQPLYAFYHRRLLPLIESEIARGALSLTRFLSEDKLCVSCVSGEDLSISAPSLCFLTNINFEEELAKITEELL